MRLNFLSVLTEQDVDHPLAETRLVDVQSQRGHQVFLQGCRKDGGAPQDAPPPRMLFNQNIIHDRLLKGVKIFFCLAQ